MKLWRNSHSFTARDCRHDQETGASGRIGLRQGARDWVGQQEKLLTDAQKRDYDKLKQQQDKERQQQQQKLDQYRKDLNQAAKQRKAISELVYHPPSQMKDSKTKEIIASVTAAEKELAKLFELHKEQKVNALKAFEQDRHREAERVKGAIEMTSKDFNESWKRAVEKTTDREQKK